VLLIQKLIDELALLRQLGAIFTQMVLKNNHCHQKNLLISGNPAFGCNLRRRGPLHAMHRNGLFGRNSQTSNLPALCLKSNDRHISDDDAFTNLDFQFQQSMPL
jgi:hypothetical protein